MSIHSINFPGYAEYNGLDYCARAISNRPPKKYPYPSIGAEMPEFVASLELPVINFLYTGYAVFNEK
jgi:hypothetical protein